MSAKLNVDINLRNAQKLRQLGDDAAQAGRKVKDALQPNSGAASAWNPYISAVKKLQQGQNDAADSAKKLQQAQKPNPGAASAWNPYISALQKIKQGQRDAADSAKKLQQAQKDAATAARQANSAAVSSGSASRWSPQISAVQQYRAELKKLADEEKRLAQVQKDAVASGSASRWSPQISQRRQFEQQQQNQALGPRANALVPTGGGINTFNNRLQSGRDAAQDRYGAAADFAQSAGMGALAIGGGGALALGASAQAAGQWQQWEVAFTQLEGSAEGAQKRLEELNQFAMSTPFSMPGVVRNAQMLRAMNFEGNELVPTMRALGNAMAATGQGEDVLNRVALNLGQIRGMENPKKVDLNQFAYAGIDVKKVMSKSMGKEMSMDDIQAMSGKEFVEKFLKGLEMEFGGMLEKQLDTLPGSLNMLTDSFFRLKVAIGGPLIPAINAVAKATAGLTNWFVKLPGPVKTTVAVLASLGTGIFLLGGIILTAAGPILNAIVAHAALTGAIGAEAVAAGTATTATGGLAVGIGALTLSFGILLGAIALATIAVGIAIDQWNKNKDKLLNKTETSQDERSFTEKASDARSTGEVTKILHDNKDASPVDRYAMLSAATKKYGELGAADEAITVQDEMAELRKKHGNLKDKTSSADAQEKVKQILGQSATDKAKQHASNGFDGYKVTATTDAEKAEVEDIKKQGEELKKQGAAMQAGMTATGAQLTVPVGLPTPPAVAAAAGGAAAGGAGAATSATTSAPTVDNTDALQSEIDSLQDQIRNAKKKDKGPLRDRLVAAQRNLRDTRRTLAAEKKIAAQAEKEAKAAERAEKKRLKEEIDYDQLESDVKEAEATEQFNTKIATLEAARDQARDDKDRAKERQLTFQIDSEKAQRDLTVAMMEADATALEDERKAEYQRRIARAKHKGAMDRARIENQKKSGAEKLLARLKSGGSIFGGREGLNAQRAASAVESVDSGSMFNPYANATQPGTGGAFTRMITAPPPSGETDAGTGANKRVLTVGNPRRTQDALGNFIFEFPKLIVPNLLEDF